MSAITPGAPLRPGKRFVRERWDGAAYSVSTEQTPLGEVTILSFIHVGPDGFPAHVIELPLDDGSRRDIAQALSGGIVRAFPSVNGGG